MKPENITADGFDQKLWGFVWEKAMQMPENSGKSIDAVVSYLAEQTTLGEATIWRYHKGKIGKWRDSTRQIFLRYAKEGAEDKFKEFFQKITEENGDARQEIIEIIGKDVFLNEIYSRLIEAGLLVDTTTKSERINAREAGLFFRLIKSLKKAYASERLFTTLTLVADSEGSMGSLSMKDYFIQLSYVTEKEIKTKDSIIRNETELNRIKIRRSLESNQQLTKDYVVNFSLCNVQNLLVLGNPGVGKSTFCRWLCYMWSDNPKTIDNLIPIYIQLKGLDFGVKQNVLVNYICKNYLIGDSTKMKELHGVLRRVSSFVCFILDGYDELSEIQKEKLVVQVNELSSNCKYILTSRPYGVINTYGLKRDRLISLNGLDLSNIHNFIEVFVRKQTNGITKTRAELIEIINLNPTLTDFAHNPLMLSFIVYIYISDDNASETLKNIQTRFDLQQTVIGWMFVHNKVKIAVKLDKSVIQAAANIAKEMEFEKTPEKTGDSNDEVVDALLIPLSKLGIGQYRENSSGKYKFYFNSITFQEYFASIAISSGITSAALEYLLQDSYFWNLTAMVIGQISSTMTPKIMDILLDICEAELKQEEKDYSYYKYVLLLSECRTEYLNTKLNRTMWQTISKAMVQNSDSGSKLKYAVAECVTRIYNKSTNEQQSEFRDVLLGQLEASWINPSGNVSNWNAYCKHLPIIVKYLELNSDRHFAKKCLHLLKIALQDIENDVVDESAPWDLPDFVLTIIQNNDDDFFQALREQCEEMLPLLPSYFVNYKGKIQLHYVSAKIALFRLRENIISHDKQKDDDATADIMADIIGEIAVYTYILGKKNRDLEIELEISEAQRALLKAAEIINEYLINRGQQYDPAYINGPRPLSQLATEGLFESVDYKTNYPKAISILAALDDEYLFFDQIIDFSLHDYFAGAINEMGIAPDNKKLQQICTMVFCIPALKNKIAFYRSLIFHWIDAYITDNPEVFQGTYPEGSVAYLLRLLERGDEAINDGDRRFFVEGMLKKSSGSLPYFKITFLPNIVRQYIVLYDGIYWDFIFSYFIENDEKSVKAGLSLFLNTTIYQYAVNVSKIQRLMSFLVKIREKPYYSELIRMQSENILTIIGHSLLMLKQTSIIPRKTSNVLVATILEIVQDETLKNEVTTRLSKNRRIGAVNAVYILLYYFTSDAKYNLNIDYWNDLQKNKQNMALIEFIYPAFLSHSVLLVDEMTKLEKVTGAYFISALNKYHEQMLVYNFPFERERFSSLCEQSKLALS